MDVEIEVSCQGFSQEVAGKITIQCPYNIQGNVFRVDAKTSLANGCTIAVLVEGHNNRHINVREVSCVETVAAIYGIVTQTTGQNIVTIIAFQDIVAVITSDVVVVQGPKNVFEVLNLIDDRVLTNNILSLIRFCAKIDRHTNANVCE